MFQIKFRAKLTSKQNAMNEVAREFAGKLLHRLKMDEQFVQSNLNATTTTNPETTLKELCSVERPVNQFLLATSAAHERKTARKICNRSNTVSIHKTRQVLV